MAGGKKRPSSSKSSKGFWDTVEGWKAVEAGDDFLLGAEQYGFAGLEMLDASALGDQLIFGGDAEALEPAAEAAPAAERPAKRSKKTKNVEVSKATANDAAGEDTAALKAQLAALRAENQALKKRQQKPKPDAGSNGSKEEQAGPTAKAAKKSKAAKAKAAKATQAANAEDATSNGGEAEQLQEAAEAAMVDVSAWGDFELDPAIEGSLARMGFAAPTHIQAECISAAVRDRRDIIGAAQTGSGKTLAFGLPILQILMAERHAATATAAAIDSAEELDAAANVTDGDIAPEVPDASRPSGGGPLRALILAPTRELAMQVCEHLQAFGRACGIWVVPLVGGISMQKQERLLKRQPPVVVATPGRLWELMRDGYPHISNLLSLSFLVIDEADRMVQQGNYAELASILDAIPKPAAARDADEGEQEAGKGEGKEEEKGEQGSKQARRLQGPPLQTFVFSATLTLPSEMRQRLKKGGGGTSGSATLDSLLNRVPFRGRGRPKIVDLTPERRLAERVSEAAISCPEEERDEYLYCLLASHPGRTIVFTNAVSAVRRLAAILKVLGMPAQALHAGMQQRKRLKALDTFKGDENGVLVATDVAARGLDVKDVRCVVHYQLPASVDVYVHRSGRTARAEANGIAIAMVTPKEAGRHQALLRALGRGQPPEFPIDDSLMPAARRRVRLALKVDEAQRKRAKQGADTSWRRRNAEELEIDLSDDEDDSNDEEQAVRGRRMGSKARKQSKKEASSSGGTAREEAQAGALRAELAELLSQPLQPSYSQRYFTGGAAAGVALQQQRRAQGKASGDGGDSSAATVSQAVAMAQRLSTSKGAAAADVQAQTADAKRKKKQKRGKPPLDPRAAALAAALRKQSTKRAGRRPMYVVPRAFGRDTKGPDALEALQQRLGTNKNSKP